MTEFQKLLDEIVEFQTTTFPNSTVKSKLYHLEKEVRELIEELETGKGYRGTMLEYADCFLLLLGSAGLFGLNGKDIFSLIREKIEINKQRKWAAPDENGVVLHIKE